MFVAGGEWDWEPPLSLCLSSYPATSAAPQKPQSRIPAERYRFILGGDRGIVAATTLSSLNGH